MKKILIVLITILALTLIGGCGSSSSSDDKKTTDTTPTQALSKEQTKEALKELSILTNAQATKATKSAGTIRRALTATGKQSIPYTLTIQGEGGGTLALNLNVSFDISAATTNMTYVITGTYTFTNFKGTKDSKYTYNGTLKYDYSMTINTSSTGTTRTGAIKYTMSTTNLTANGIPLNMNLNFEMTYPGGVLTYSGSVNGVPYSEKEQIDLGTVETGY